MTVTVEAGETPSEPALAGRRLSAAAEFVAWRDSLPVRAGVGRQYPAPRDPGGLPPGWVIAASGADVLPGSDFYLARRPAGDAMVVGYETATERTRLFSFAASLPALFGLFRIIRDDPDDSPDPVIVALADWLRQVIVGLFDPADPVEAVEQTLFALGGPLRRIPKAAR